MIEMRIQNTTNSIANAICRCCVKGLSVLRISSLPLTLWHLLCTRVGKMTRLAAQMLGNLDADICRYLGSLSGKRLAMAVCVPAPVEARVECQELMFIGNPNASFRSPV
jgi:hypothetical protein